MKKTLLFISLLVAAFVSKAQISVLYNHTLVNDTIEILAPSPDEENYIYLTCKNDGSENVTLRVTATRIYGSEDVNVMSICVPGSCVPGLVSGTFDLAANAEAEFDAWVEIGSDIAANTATLYQFTIQDQNDENNKTIVFVKYIIKLGVNALAQNTASINLYPNPTKNIAYVDYNLSGYNTDGSKIEIRNMLGSVVKEVSIESNQGTQAINVNDIPNGVYLCSVVCNGKVCQTKKMVVKH